jgi:hypothetical protein
MILFSGTLQWLNEGQQIPLLCDTQGPWKIKDDIVLYFFRFKTHKWRWEILSLPLTQMFYGS